MEGVGGWWKVGSVFDERESLLAHFVGEERLGGGFLIRCLFCPWQLKLASPVSFWSSPLPLSPPLTAFSSLIVRFATRVSNLER